MRAKIGRSQPRSPDLTDSHPRKGAHRTVKRTLINKSQEQPVIKAAAAGGNKMATRMSRISEDLTIVAAVINRA